MAGEIRSLVSAEEALAVANKIHGPSVNLLDYEVEKGTETVQGFTSNILRVAIRVKVGEELRQSKFVIKRQPLLESQKRMAEELGLFQQEIGYFDKCVPILLERCPDLPAVTCYLTDPEKRIIYMEDLREGGFGTIVRNVADLKKNTLMMDHVKMVMQTLAKYHSASVGINWLKKFPELFTEDVFFESNDGTTMRNCIKQAVKKTLLPIAKHHFKEERYVKSVEWVGSDDFYQVLIDMCKPDPKSLNVLCHGDSWANNMMFKIEPETGKTLQIKLIDFQLSRYAPGNRDLLYFLYLCCTPDFRKENKKELLATYWATFTEECAKNGIVLEKSWKEFCADFERDRVFGIMMAAVWRPTIFMEGNFPDGDEELTDEQMNNIMDGGGAGPEKALEDFEKIPAFRHELISVIEEVADVFYELYQKN